MGSLRRFRCVFAGALFGGGRRTGGDVSDGGTRARNSGTRRGGEIEKAVDSASTVGVSDPSGQPVVPSAQPAPTAPPVGVIHLLPGS